MNPEERAGKVQDDLRAAVAALIRESYLEGIELAIRELAIVSAWLLRHPDTKRQAETRQWVENRISELRKKLEP